MYKLIRVHESAKISPKCDIEDSIKGSIIEIGSHSVIDSFVKFKPTGGLGNIVIGKRVHINSCCVIYSGNGVSIGDDVLIASNCTFAPVNHEYKESSMKISEQGHAKSKGGIIIENNVWIGANTVILDGAKVCEGSVIAAGSIVRGICNDKSLYGGNPLKKIKNL